jgi:hypothetical protein
MNEFMRGASRLCGARNGEGRATRCLSKTKPREREAETECEEGERAPSLQRESGTRGDPRSQRQGKTAVEREREEKRERRTRSPEGNALESRSQGKTRGKRRTTREEESKRKRARRSEPRREAREGTKVESRQRQGKSTVKGRGTGGGRRSAGPVEGEPPKTETRNRRRRDAEQEKTRGGKRRQSKEERRQKENREQSTADTYFQLRNARLCGWSKSSESK